MVAITIEREIKHYGKITTKNAFGEMLILKTLLVSKTKHTKLVCLK